MTGDVQTPPDQSDLSADNDLGVGEGTPVAARSLSRVPDQDRLRVIGMSIWRDDAVLAPLWPRRKRFRTPRRPPYPRARPLQRP
jgi:hypothetical protein